MSMTNREIEEYVDAFKYWCETNEENGVITLPKFLCGHIIDILDDNKKRPHGEWVFVHPLQEDDDGAYMCSICGNGDWGIDPERDKYCYNCGALMIKKDGEENKNL